MQRSPALAKEALRRSQADRISDLVADGSTLAQACVGAGVTYSIGMGLFGFVHRGLGTQAR